MTNKLYKPLLIDSILATTDLPKHRFISFDGNVSSAGNQAYGICDVETEAKQYAPIGITGILLIEAGGEIAVGDAITSDANGKAVKVATNNATNGFALDSGKDGDIIRIVRGL